MSTLLINGASSGIGKATIVWFSEKGWNVAATMRDPSKHQDLARLKNVKLYALDVTKAEQTEQTVAAVLENFLSISVFVNNAGNAEIGPFKATEDAEILRQFETNVFGLLRLTRAVLPHFRERKAGMVINIPGGRTNYFSAFQPVTQHVIRSGRF